jgi:tRNA (guanine6-N2)-methyltransferase
MPCSILPFFALTASGLEATSAREVAMLPSVSISSISYRRITATCSGELARLCSLRTVDDVFLEVASWMEIGRPRSSLERLRHLGAALDLHPAAAHCACLRPVGRPPTFSLTVSFVGKRNYTGDEIKAVLAGAIEQRHRGWHYQQDDRAADLNVRVFLEHDVATVGVRLAKTALHDRSYQRVHLPGALKPSVAAALLLLAQTPPNATLLDPCCGSGTILIEAALQGATVYGGDLNAGAVEAARANAAAAGVRACIQQRDATSLPIADGVMDRVITNLPWGRQVAIAGTLPSLYRRIFAQMRRVLAPAGRIVVLTNAPDEIDPLDLACVERIEISLFGQRPTILVFASPDATR